MFKCVKPNVKATFLIHAWRMLRKSPNLNQDDLDTHTHSGLLANEGIPQQNGSTPLVLLEISKCRVGARPRNVPLFNLYSSRRSSSSVAVKSVCGSMSDSPPPSKAPRGCGGIPKDRSCPIFISDSRGLGFFRVLPAADTGGVSAVVATCRE
ncbi:hypothetical protein DM02DRAFT_8312 [Periconia macrospinosa]|uniref:Uncharacterized protein n=1 Tax=Periconia macrospinosa TaxID=97972 RepID=A0A2V1EDK7_9PLEO|nr:hypothetical protein DM02DRAFT_8312 [Periconia macrospinosa]